MGWDTPGTPALGRWRLGDLEFSHSLLRSELRRAWAMKDCLIVHNKNKPEQYWRYLYPTEMLTERLNERV